VAGRDRIRFCPLASSFTCPETPSGKRPLQAHLPAPRGTHPSADWGAPICVNRLP
jgi:hypothetical protein